MIRSLAFCIIAIIIGSSVGLAPTSTRARNFRYGSTWCTGRFLFSTANVYVEGSTSEGTPCAINYGIYSDILGYSVVQQPHHGMLGNAGSEGGRFLTAYKPNAGYMGTDEFAVKVRFAPRSTQVEATTVIHVHMTVGR